MSVRRTSSVVLAFGLTGLCGPVLALTVLQWSTPGEGLYFYFYNLIALIWPTWLLAMMDSAWGRLVAGIVSIGSNVLLFSLLGCVATLLARYNFGLLAAFLLIVLLAAALGMRLDLNLFSIATAMLIHGAPFLITARYLRQK